MTGVDADRATVGCLLLLPLAQVRGLLDAVDDTDPSDPRLRLVLALARELASTGQRPDPVAVWTHARASGRVTGGQLAALGGFLADLVAVDSCPVPAAAGAYARGVVEGAVRRRVTEASQRLAAAATDANLSALLDLVDSETRALGVAVARLHGPLVIAA